MLYALTAEQSRVSEQRAVEAGADLADLMRSAGETVAAIVAQRAPDGPIAVLAGPGNNGGDGWVAARVLHEAGRDVRVWAIRGLDDLSGIAADAALESVASGVAYEVVDGPLPEAALDGVAVVVDALLGTGSSGALRDPLPSWVEAVNRSEAFVVAVDAPTGVDSDSGAVVDEAVVASLTVSFSTPKLGLVLYPGAGYAGPVVVVDIGVPVDFTSFDGAPEIWSLDDYASALPIPAPNAHKYERGEVLVVAGSAAYAGAAVLCARGAQRAGAGYVRLAVPAPIVPVAQTVAPSVVTVGLPADDDGSFAPEAAERVAALAARADAVALGPGLTLGDGASRVAEAIVATGAPLVLDADGLNAFAERGRELASRPAPTVLTPHAGELARLVGKSASELELDRVSSSAMLASDDVTVVLKGAGTVVCGAGRTVVTPAGTPALATAGTGDVLTGVIAALLAQGLDPLDAGVLGAWLHARAGEAAAAELSVVSVIAEDVPHFLGQAVAELLGEGETGS